jgi:hypothetical protein
MVARSHVEVHPRLPEQRVGVVPPQQIVSPSCHRSRPLPVLSLAHATAPRRRSRGAGWNPHHGWSPNGPAGVAAARRHAMMLLPARGYAAPLADPRSATQRQSNGVSTRQRRRAPHSTCVSAPTDSPSESQRLALQAVAAQCGWSVVAGYDDRRPGLGALLL